MKDIRHKNIDTQTVHAGIEEDPNGAVVTPIYQTSTFRFRNVQHGADLFAGTEEGYIYTRMRNPTVEAMENAVAILEGGARALGCGSGMAAIHTAFAALLQTGDHVVCSESVYGPTSTLLKTVISRFGITSTFVDTSNLAAVREAMTPATKVIYIETPGNPTLVMSDIAAIAEIAKTHHATLVVDNTFMGPILQRPFDLGADVIVHSLTKSLNGHADVVGGIVVLRDETMYPHFRKTLNQIGGVIDPFNSFLVHRGIKTLALRVRHASESAMRVAEYLEAHPKVEWVRYPGLKSHPQYELGTRQMSGHGSMISFELRGGIDAGVAVMNNVHLCQLAVSLGGVESLIQHPASMTHASMGKEQRTQAAITDGLVRLSVGIESVEEIIADLDHALAQC
ncbi:MAG: aminotransferase class I/II-fold pyridoxal phosphate-dependent enzyme [Bacteroidota bacterium]|nr:aminotransferase class I/II-fold pyridoxal phosphate-dependent enzyme [Bacteroidota bacterium]